MKENQYKKFMNSFFGVVLFLFSWCSYSQLIISQVYEGANDNKWIEITNTSMTSINLSSPIQYKVGIWQAAGSSGNAAVSGSPTHFINLSGVLSHGQKYLIKNTNTANNVPHSGIPTANNSNITVASFDGNDGLAIFKDASSIVDAFGSGINYNDISYIRNSNVVYSKSVFATNEWVTKTLVEMSGYPQNGFQNQLIGTHYFGGALFQFSNQLSSLNMQYGGTSSITSFVVTRVLSQFFEPSGGVGVPPPPGFCTNTFITPPLGFEISLSPTFSSTIGTNSNPLNIGNPCEYSKTIYIRLVQNLIVGNYSGEIKFSSPLLVDYYFQTNAVNTVSAKSLTISGIYANNKQYDGNTTATIGGSPMLLGVLPTDNLNVSLGGEPIANFEDESVGENKSVIITGYTISGSASANYFLNQPQLTASIIGVKILNLKVFIQGFFDGNQQMSASRGGQNSVQAYVDDIVVELIDPVTLQVVESTTANLQTDGSSVCSFLTAPEGNFYITVKGSNSIKTWSANPIPIGFSNNNYDFSNNVSKAYGGNLVEVDSGIWAILSGDVNGDGNVDNSDYSNWETDANNFAYGVFLTDLNGDGNVDNVDYSIWEENANKFSSSIEPILN